MSLYCHGLDKFFTILLGAKQHICIDHLMIPVQGKFFTEDFAVSTMQNINVNTIMLVCL